MYKVFFNDSLIFFDTTKDNSYLGNICQVVEIESVDVFFDFLKKIEDGKYVEELQFKLQIPFQLYQDIREMLTEIPAAGGLVKNSKGELLFIKRFGRWDLPKGKIEQNETPLTAAFREVEEECGLSELELVKPLPSTYHIYRSPYIKGENNLVWKETHWFEMIHAGKGEVVPQTEEQIEEVRWFSKDQLKEVYSSTYKNLQELLDYYLA